MSEKTLESLKKQIQHMDSQIATLLKKEKNKKSSTKKRSSKKRGSKKRGSSSKKHRSRCKKGSRKRCRSSVTKKLLKGNYYGHRCPKKSKKTCAKRSSKKKSSKKKSSKKHAKKHSKKSSNKKSSKKRCKKGSRKRCRSSVTKKLLKGNYYGHKCPSKSKKTCVKHSKSSKKHSKKSSPKKESSKRKQLMAMCDIKNMSYSKRSSDETLLSQCSEPDYITYLKHYGDKKKKTKKAQKKKAPKKKAQKKKVPKKKVPKKVASKKLEDLPTNILIPIMLKMSPGDLQKICEKNQVFENMCKNKKFQELYNKFHKIEDTHIEKIGQILSEDERIGYIFEDNLEEYGYLGFRVNEYRIEVIRQDDGKLLVVVDDKENHLEFTDVDELWLGSGANGNPFDIGSQDYMANTILIVQEHIVTSISSTIVEFKLNSNKGEHVTRYVSTLDNSDGTPYGWIETNLGYYATEFNCVTGYISKEDVENYKDEYEKGSFYCWNNPDSNLPLNKMQSIRGYKKIV